MGQYARSCRRHLSWITEAACASRPLYRPIASPDPVRGAIMPCFTLPMRSPLVCSAPSRSDRQACCIGSLRRYSLHAESTNSWPAAVSPRARASNAAASDGWAIWPAPQTFRRAPAPSETCHIWQVRHAPGRPSRARCSGDTSDGGRGAAARDSPDASEQRAPRSRPR